MFEHKGIWMPDGEQHLLDYMAKVPLVEGKGNYQFEKIHLALKLVKQFRTAVDVGGHIGLWSMHLAPRFQRVMAFEPMAAHRECFARNVTAANVTLLSVALGAQPGVAPMISPDAGHTMLSKVDPGQAGQLRQVALVQRPGHSGDTRVDPSKTGAVPLHTLDQYELQDVDFIKIDTEGFEWFVLQGARETLHRCKPALIVEQKPNNAQRYGLREQQAVEWLLSEGWRLRGERAGDFFMTYAGAA